MSNEPFIRVVVECMRGEKGQPLIKTTIEEDTDKVTKKDYAMLYLELGGLMRRIEELHVPDFEVEEGDD